MPTLALPTDPGTTVRVAVAPGGAGTPTATATAFFTGICDRGPAGVLIPVIDAVDYASKCGGRSGTAAVLSDSVELAFGEGTSAAYVSRVVGPTPTLGTLSLMDQNATPAATLKVDAAWYGAGSASLSVQVSAGGPAGSYTLSVFDATQSTVSPAEVYPDLVDIPSAVTLINSASTLIHVTDLASASPLNERNPAVVAATPLSAGTDDRTNATDTEWGNAIAVCADPQYGPGILLAPGRTNTSVHALLQGAALASSRVAYLDTPDQPNASAVVTAAATDAAIAGLDFPGDLGLLFGPWVQMSPAPGTSTPRYVPGSAYAAGRTAATDAAVGHSNLAPMGRNGTAQYAVGVHGPLSEADRATVNGRAGTAGGCVIRQTLSEPCQLYGFRTVSANPSAYFGANIRQTLLIKHLAGGIGDTFVGRQIDGRGHVFADLGGDLTAMLLGFFNLDVLYGATAAAAFGVDTGNTVNTPSTIAQGLIKARVWFVLSTTGERVVLDLIRQGIPAAA